MSMTSVYSEYEKHSPTTYTRKCIDGRITGCSNCIGYCQYEGHPGFLTAKHRKEHDCLGKDCFYYVAKPVKEKSARTIDRSAEVLAIAQNVFAQHDGMKIVRAREESLSSWILSYVALFSDVAYISSLEQVMQKTGCTIQLERLDYDFDTCVRIIYA